MELLQIKNLTFFYPDSSAEPAEKSAEKMAAALAQKSAEKSSAISAEKTAVPALCDVSFSLAPGSFTLLCGASGCGKSTLLRLIKPEIAPVGALSGTVRFSFADGAQAPGAIGYVGQNPAQQIVTDQVWHELAFGLENLGLPQAEIRSRVAEMASDFGIGSWYHRDTDTLSGGQKQLLNLASVMVMQPKLLLLDEPCAYLDPVAAADFIQTLTKLNRETGLTVLIAEHRLESLFPIADRVLLMDDGAVIANDTPDRVCRFLAQHPLADALPAAARIYLGLQSGTTPTQTQNPPQIQNPAQMKLHESPSTAATGAWEAVPVPLTVRAGREYLMMHYAAACKTGFSMPLPQPQEHGEAVLQAKNLWFRYDRNGADVLSGASLTLYAGEIAAVLGANGSGKSTLLHVLCALGRPYQGSLRVMGKSPARLGAGLYRGLLSLLPQDSGLLFLEMTVREELQRACREAGMPQQQSKQAIAAIAATLGISDLLSRNPFDLSGGELQKCALARLLLSKPKILLLDEPTKGMDAAYKRTLAGILRSLRAEGRCILLVTHDVEFAAAVADRCGLFFDGQVLPLAEPHAFFGKHYFYTTAAGRIARDLFDGAIRTREVIALCGEK